MQSLVLGPRPHTMLQACTGRAGGSFWITDNRQDVTIQEALSISPQIQRKMTQIYGWIGTPGAKAQPSLAGTRHSVAKRKRGPASEPVWPGEALSGRWGWGDGEPQSLPTALSAAMGELTPSTIGELAVSAVPGNIPPHGVGVLSLPCRRTSHLCREELPYKGPPVLYFLAPPPTALPGDCSLAWPFPLPGTLCSRPGVSNSFLLGATSASQLPSKGRM